MLDRRELGVLAVAAVGLAACDQVDVGKLEQQLADILTKIQQGVKDACNLVPTANSVLAVLQALASSKPDVAAYLASIQQAIALIASACPQPNQPLTAKPNSATVKDKTVTIVFY